MKILLLGEYSNVHYTLALGLRSLGHDVTLASDGDNWKNYPRDIDMRRKSLSPLSSISYLWKTWNQIQSFKGYDIVQLINPVFIPLKGKEYGHFTRNFERLMAKLLWVHLVWIITMSNVALILRPLNTVISISETKNDFLMKMNALSAIGCLEVRAF